MSRVHQALEQLDRRQAVAVVQGSDERRGSGHLPSDAGEYERLASRIVQARMSAPFHTMMVVAPDHGDGTSTVARGLATALAERAGLSVVLVDANFRSPALADAADLGATAGFAEALRDEIALDAAIAIVDRENLALVPAGDVDAGSPRLLATDRFDAVRDALAKRADVVIFDGPPVLPYADALTLASKVDRVILVTQADRTQRGRLEQAAEELDKSGAIILGVVLNRAASHAPPWLARRLNF